MIANYAKKTLALLCIIITIIFLSGCEKKKYYKYTLALESAFNTVNSVTVFTLRNRPGDPEEDP